MWKELKKFTVTIILLSNYGPSFFAGVGVQPTVSLIYLFDQLD